MDLDTFLTTLYVLVDDWYKAEGSKQVVRRKAGKMKMSDSEVLTLAIAGQWEAGTPWHGERGLLRFLEGHQQNWFPQLLRISAFNRRVRHLCTALSALQNWFARMLGYEKAHYEVMDGLPLPVCSLGQQQRDKQHWLGQVSSRGHGGTEGGWFYGQRWWMTVSSQGIMGDWLVAAAHLNERWVLDRLLATRALVTPVDPPQNSHLPLSRRTERPRGFMGGYFAVTPELGNKPIFLDRGLNGRLWQQHWWRDYGARTVTIPPDNAAEREDWTRDDCLAHASRRQVVETVFSVLTTVFGIKQIGAHSLWGQYTRLAAKAAAFNFGLFLNHALGRKRFAFATLIV